ncbi:MAG: hypothetical protein KDD69_00845 [Bdellovibrionales bacterium]|nr:hypothetical protein [Bdellovibrionales bacterium]
MIGFLSFARRAVVPGTAIVLSLLLSSTLFSEDAQAQRYASKQRANAATGHYARARAMMVEALKEFEQGRRLARPDLLVDSEDFRLKLISLTEELNRVIDPKPRITRDGAVFRASPRMVRRERDALPPVPGGPLDSNVYGEEQRLHELEQARARMYQEQRAPAATTQSPDSEATAEQQDAVVVEPSEATDARSQEAFAAQDQPAGRLQQSESATEVPVEPEIPAEQQEDIGLSDSTAEEGDEETYAHEGSEAKQLDEGGKELSQDQQIANQIEQAIQERIRSLEVNTPDEQGVESSGEELELEE